MLMPAAVLVVLVLAAITVDTAVVHLARRELRLAADSAASDAVAYGLDERRLRAGEGPVLDAGRVHDAVVGNLAADRLLDRLAAPPEVTIGADGSITVTLTRRVDDVFGRALGADDTLVRARGRASPVRR